MGRELAEGPVWVLAGPTASGKTAAALEWAQKHDAEIVGADSQQLYRHFDIGTAKPSVAELERVPHHLVSALDPLEGCSAARYQALADAAIADIQRRGKRALVVGGTGLYVRVLLHGVVQAPPAQPEVRAELEARAAREGWPALHHELAAVDPETAARVSVNDPVRIVRALELYRATGEPASEHRRRHGFDQRRYRYAMRVLTPPREKLYAAIDARTEAMFRAGLIDEVKSLLARGYADAAPMGAVGYKQARAVVEGRQALGDAIAETAQKTRHYAKRQLTWFAKDLALFGLGEVPFP